jgi:hypothetical protein
MSRPLQLDIDQKVEALFRAYATEEFEDGVDSEFICEITAIIRIDGTKAVEAIKRIIHEQNLLPYMAFEALRWLGRVHHPESYRSRLFLLETCLDSPSRLMRDGAALGLASMKDSHAIPYLRNAVAREGIEDLREDMKAVLLRLENSSHAPISVDDEIQTRILNAIQEGYVDLDKVNKSLRKKLYNRRLFVYSKN